VTKFVTYRKKLIERGIYKLPVNLKRNHISLSHSKADIDETLSAADKVMGELKG
jgi:glutamate-1-semialdehyde 2,1-aminomutase